jgi:hypothetical protein
LTVITTQSAGGSSFSIAKGPDTLSGQEGEKIGNFEIAMADSE